MREGYAFGVSLVDPPRALVLRQQPRSIPGMRPGPFLIVPVSAERSRLLSRSRTAKTPGAAGVAARIGAELMGPIILLMTRKMLLGIKERAEHQARRSSAEPAFATITASE